MDEPLPLISWNDSDVVEDDVEETNWLGIYGYSMLAVSWVIFIISINTFFKLWRFVILPLKLTNTGFNLYDKLSYHLQVFDSYVIRIWNIYIVIWWWAIVSWLGLKLFKHSQSAKR